MKIITLVPVKNEAWILHFSLTNFSLFSDEIIILDDGSTDESMSIAKTFPKVAVIPFTAKEKHVDMSVRRNKLLEEGRLRGGTHFVCLDADETLSSRYISILRDHLESLSIGDTLLLPWITVFQKNDSYYFSEKETTSYKNFIFCDDKKSMYPQQSISETRTPPLTGNNIHLPYEDGCVFHFQYIAQERTAMKQVWYMCNELVEGRRSARRINATYRHTKGTADRYKEPVDDSFVMGVKNTINTSISDSYHKEKVLEFFKTYSILFFENLDIWHIQSLYDQFKKEVGKAPIPKTFPSWLLWANDLKNKLKNGIL